MADFNPKSTLRDLGTAVGAFGLQIQVLKARTGQPACSPCKVAKAASICSTCSGLLIAYIQRSPIQEGDSFRSVRLKLHSDGSARLDTQDMGTLSSRSTQSRR
jgi:hypothetical protein